VLRAAVAGLVNAEAALEIGLFVVNANQELGSGAGLPDGTLSYKKSQFGYIMKCLGMVFKVIWYTL
jgi:hypothetical protein